MIDSQSLIRLYERSYREITAQVAGLTHDDSLVQLPFRGNCLNWVIGHIVSSRFNPIRKLGGTSPWTDEERARYRMGSAPITAENAHEAYRFEDILAALDDSQRALLDGLQRATPESLDARAFPDDANDTRSLADYLAYMLWHEAYHTGQLEYLRQLAGKNDAVF